MHLYIDVLIFLTSPFAAIMRQEFGGFNVTKMGVCMCIHASIYRCICMVNITLGAIMAQAIVDFDVTKLCVYVCIYMNLYIDAYVYLYTDAFIWLHHSSRHYDAVNWVF